jgi:hypothetical protein
MTSPVTVHDIATRQHLGRESELRAELETLGARLHRANIDEQLAQTLTGLALRIVRSCSERRLLRDLTP